MHLDLVNNLLSTCENRTWYETLWLVSLKRKFSDAEIATLPPIPILCEKFLLELGKFDKTPKGFRDSARVVWGTVNLYSCKTNKLLIEVRIVVNSCDKTLYNADWINTMFAPLQKATIVADNQQTVVDDEEDNDDYEGPSSKRRKLSNKKQKASKVKKETPRLLDFSDLEQIEKAFMIGDEYDDYDENPKRKQAKAVKGKRAEKSSSIAEHMIDPTLRRCDEVTIIENINLETKLKKALTDADNDFLECEDSDLVRDLTVLIGNEPQVAVNEVNEQEVPEILNSAVSNFDNEFDMPSIHIENFNSNSQSQLGSLKSVKNMNQLEEVEAMQNDVMSILSEAKTSNKRESTNVEDRVKKVRFDETNNEEFPLVSLEEEQVVPKKRKSSAKNSNTPKKRKLIIDKKIIIEKNFPNATPQVDPPMDTFSNFVSIQNHGARRLFEKPAARQCNNKVLKLFQKNLTNIPKHLQKKIAFDEEGKVVDNFSPKRPKRPFESDFEYYGLTSKRQKAIKNTTKSSQNQDNENEIQETDFNSNELISSTAFMPNPRLFHLIDKTIPTDTSSLTINSEIRHLIDYNMNEQTEVSVNSLNPENEMTKTHENNSTIQQNFDNEQIGFNHDEITSSSTPCKKRNSKDFQVERNFSSPNFLAEPIVSCEIEANIEVQKVVQSTRLDIKGCSEIVIRRQIMMRLKFYWSSKMKAVTLNELCSDCTRIIASRVFLELMFLSKLGVVELFQGENLKISDIKPAKNADLYD